MLIDNLVGRRQLSVVSCQLLVVSCQWLVKLPSLGLGAIWRGVQVAFAMARQRGRSVACITIVVVGGSYGEKSREVEEVPFLT